MNDEPVIWETMRLTDYSLAGGVAANYGGHLLLSRDLSSPTDSSDRDRRLQAHFHNSLQSNNVSIIANHNFEAEPQMTVPSRWMASQAFIFLPT